ncbi:MAG TPA: hypothetical protein VG148_03745 [Pyrinomonadaceae bacterium]|nr:hypothetical protein [Pyrinomonadaceae bacterium]
MKSPEVGKLQDELIDLGYLRPEQKASGPNSFGPRTEAALPAPTYLARSGPLWGG